MRHDVRQPREENQDEKKRAVHVTFRPYAVSKSSSLHLFFCGSNVSIMYLPSTVSIIRGCEGHPMRTFVANFRLVKVSLRCAWNGLIITNMSVFELPPREVCKR